VSYAKLPLRVIGSLVPDSRSCMKAARVVASLAPDSSLLYGGLLGYYYMLIGLNTCIVETPF
jgi:hypothetical protein